MAADTVEQIAQEIVGLTDVDPNIARTWVRDAARRVFEERQWSFLLKKSALTVPATVTGTSTGTTCTIDSATPDIVTLSGAIVTDAFVGRQFRISQTTEIYEITNYLSPTSFRIFPAWPDVTLTGSGFQILQSRVPLPSDCLRVLSAVDVVRRWQLHLDMQQETLDFYDPSRSRYGARPAVLASCDYTQDWVGRVYPSTRVVGSGTSPHAGGEYTGQSDAIYTVGVEAPGGAGGVATFWWRRNEEAATTGVVSDTATGNYLADGVTVLWDAPSAYTAGDVFVIRTQASGRPSVPRVEVYPITGQLTHIPIYYLARYPDITDDGVTLPGLLAGRSDIVKEKALEFAAAYPGTATQPNPYNQISRRDYHALTYKSLVEQLGQQDNELFQRNVKHINMFPLAPLPWGNRYPQEYDDPSIFRSADIWIW